MRSRIPSLVLIIVTLLFTLSSTNQYALAEIRSKQKARITVQSMCEQALGHDRINSIYYVDSLDKVFVPHRLWTLINHENLRRRRLIYFEPQFYPIKKHHPNGIHFSRSVYSIAANGPVSLGYDLAPIESVSDLVGFLDDHDALVQQALNILPEQYHQELTELRHRLQTHLPLIFQASRYQGLTKASSVLSAILQTSNSSNGTLRVQLNMKLKVSRHAKLWQLEQFISELETLGAHVESVWRVWTNEYLIRIEARPRLIQRALAHPNTIHGDVATW